MKHDFLDIVAVIVRHISEQGGYGLRDKNIIEGLLDEGYDLVDIDDALTWLEDITSAGGDLHEVEFWPGFHGVRVQSRLEREMMTPSAFAYLGRLNITGFIEDSLREAVIDKVVELAIPGFGAEQMKSLVGIVLFSQKASGFDEPHGWPEDRGRDTLYH